MLYRKFPGGPIRSCTPHTQLAFLRPTILPNLRSTIVVASIISNQTQTFYAVESHPALWQSFRGAACRVWIALDLRHGGY